MLLLESDYLLAVLCTRTELLPVSLRREPREGISI